MLCQAMQLAAGMVAKETDCPMSRLRGCGTGGMVERKQRKSAAQLCSVCSPGKTIGAQPEGPQTWATIPMCLCVHYTIRSPLYLN